MGSKNVFFSICIPTYNSVHYVKKLLNSILNQTFNDFEIIISDDSTTDEVMKYCYGVDDNRLKYYTHKSILSATENWNNALNLATGKYRMLVHHDDYFSNVNVLLNIFLIHEDKGEKDAFFLGFQNENNLTKNYYDKFCFRDLLLNPNILLFINYLSAPSCLVLNEKISLRYNENLKWLVDVEFYKRLINNYGKIEYIPQVKMVIGGGVDRITNTISNNDKLSEYLYLRKQNVYKYKIGIYFIKFTKLKIYIIEYLKKLFSNYYNA